MTLRFSLEHLVVVGLGQVVECLADSTLEVVPVVMQVDVAVPRSGPAVW